MEDINHSCQIAGGARIDVGVHWRIVRYFLGNNSSFREVIITINGLHWNENDITASFIEKKKKKGLQCGTIILDRATISRCTALIKQLILWPPQSNFYFPTMFTNSLLSPSAVRHTCREGSCTQTAISQLSWPLPSAWCEAHEPASQRA